MGTYHLDDPKYSSLKFRKDLWKGVAPLGDPFPILTRISSKSENQDFAWVFGMVCIEGQGKVKVLYPYLEEHEENFPLKNVCYSYYPFVRLQAEGDNFEGWFDGEGNLLEKNEDLVISEYDYTEISEFIARFAKT